MANLDQSNQFNSIFEPNDHWLAILKQMLLKQLKDEVKEQMKQLKEQMDHQWALDQLAKMLAQDRQDHWLALLKQMLALERLVHRLLPQTQHLSGQGQQIL
ncbi:hypothetical protein PGT21_022386 [Puccinia graminis f. sp. tritici]|uniref:Uncharacterized protein n=1 Tax=Puccinia graminis f. sp. tritici TaxID=56615 RepID=A0A5B0Q453_PUCGR|nr:hypothetical protein PGT21_022386 [Puccinia graminis f. sp. tritici]